MSAMRSVGTAVLLCGGAAAAALHAPADARHVLPRTAEPVAVFVQVTGPVQVRPAAGGAAEAAAVGRGVAPGDSVAIGGGGKAVLLYRTGRMQTVEQGLRISDPREAETGTLYSRTMRTISQVATTDVRSQPNRQGMIRPLPGQAAPIAPRNGITVLDARPEFHWFASPGATRYTLQLRRTDITGERPVRFDAGADTAWRFPGAIPPLAAGGTYEWTVGAAGRVAPVQRFVVASAALRAEVDAGLAEVDAAGLDPADALFLRALLYREAGLFYDAERMLRQLAGAGAGGRVFHMLRGDVYDSLGDLDAAAAAFAEADRERAD
jgi:hypothetical protein